MLQLLITIAVIYLRICSGVSVGSGQRPAEHGTTANRLVRRENFQHVSERADHFTFIDNEEKSEAYALFEKHGPRLISGDAANTSRIASFFEKASRSYHRVGVAATVREFATDAQKVIIEYKPPAHQIIFFLINFLIAAIWAYKYKTDVVDRVPRLDGGYRATKYDDFQIGIVDCCSDMGMCCNIWQCSICRNAHTWEAAGLLDYWLSVVLQVFCCPFQCCIGIYFRIQLRQAVGIQSNLFMDMMVYCCGCGCCAAGQEALEVDRITGVTYGCPFQLFFKQPLVQVLPAPAPPPAQQRM